MKMKSLKNNNDPWVPLHDHNASEFRINASASSEEGGSSAAFLNSPPEDPLHTFIDSERYIQSLERKLERLKKKRENPSSKDIIDSLALFQEDQMRNYVNSDSQSLCNSNDAETSLTPSYMKRKLFPELQAINAIEVAELVKEDFVEKSFEELSLDNNSNPESHKDNTNNSEPNE